VERTTVTVHPVAATHVAAVVAKRAIPLTVWEHASKTLSTLIGLAMVTVMMVLTFLLIMVMAAQQVLLSGLTAQNLTATVATVLATVVEQAHAA
jgi:branched-subunit amino acid transport protein AzlD